MDRAEDQRRYFLFASAVYEVVIPVFKQRLETHYRGLGCPDFKTFLNHQPALHILFHLKYRNRQCCFDAANCNNIPHPPMFYDQWNQLYTNSTSPKCARLCHCNFTANQVDLLEIDLTLASLILINVCSLPPAEVTVIHNLRKFKNKYLSHNNNGGINSADFDILWTDLMTNILQLDLTKKDDLIRIQDRPLDASLCNKYRIEFNDIRTKLDEIDNKIDSRNNTIDSIDEKMDSRNKRIDSIDEKIDSIQEMMLTERTTKKVKRVDDIIQRPPYMLGQDIFCPQYTEINVNSLLPGNIFTRCIYDVLMTDDDRIAMCMGAIKSLLICNSIGSSVYTIPLEGNPWSITTITDSIVAVTLSFESRVQVCDINRRVMLRTIQLPDRCWGIALINNRLAVGGRGKIWMIDYQTGKITNTIQTVEAHLRLHTSCDKLISCHYKSYLTFYKLSGDKLFSTTTLTLPSNITGITSFHDGSLYVLCLNGRVYHVSSDGQRYTPVETEGISITGIFLGGGLCFNERKQKIVLSIVDKVKIFHVC